MGINLFFYRGMDPLMFAALTGVAAAGVGFFAGGALHSEFWKVVNKEKHRQLTQVLNVAQCCICLCTLCSHSIYFIMNNM